MGDIAVTKDVGEAIVLERVDIDIEPACLVSERRCANKFRCALRGHNVKHIKVLSHCFLVVHSSESCTSVVFVDGGQLMVQELVDSLTFTVFGQGRAEIIIRWEDNWSCTVVVDGGVVSHSVLPEC